MHFKKIMMATLLTSVASSCVHAEQWKVQKFVSDHPKLTVAAAITGVVAYTAYRRIKSLFATVETPIANFDDGISIVEVTMKNFPYMPGSSLKMYKDGVEIGGIMYLYVNNQYQLGNFFVDKAYRGKGYGTQLLQTMVTMLKDRGATDIYIGAEPFEKRSFSRVKLLTGQEREVAVEKLVKLYRKHGFASLSHEEAKRSGAFSFAQSTTHPMRYHVS